jgi:hypothetical protein
MVHASLQPGAHAGAQSVGRHYGVRRPYDEHRVAVAAHPGSRPAQVRGRHGQWGQGAVVDVHEIPLGGVGGDRMAAVSVQERRQVPVADVIAVGPDDGGIASGERGVEGPCRTAPPPVCDHVTSRPSRSTVVASRRSKYCQECVNPRVTTRLSSWANSHRM